MKKLPAWPCLEALDTSRLQHLIGSYIFYCLLTNHSFPFSKKFALYFLFALFVLVFCTVFSLLKLYGSQPVRFKKCFNVYYEIQYIVIISSSVVYNVYNEWTRAFRKHSDFHSAKNHSLSNQSLGSTRRNALHKLW